MPSPRFDFASKSSSDLRRSDTAYVGTEERHTHSSAAFTGRMAAAEI